MQMNECIKLLKIVYENVIYDDIIFVSENLCINIKVYLYKLIFISLKISQSKQYLINCENVKSDAH